jgi:hypothetical protein
VLVKGEVVMVVVKFEVVVFVLLNSEVVAIVVVKGDAVLNVVVWGEVVIVLIAVVDVPLSTTKVQASVLVSKSSISWIGAVQ